MNLTLYFIIHQVSRELSNEDSICTVFKRTEGTTVMRYINRTKLENIKALMEHNNLRLYEAAALYGYADPNYVSRLFKQLFGYNITEKPRVHPTIK